MAKVAFDPTGWAGYFTVTLRADQVTDTINQAFIDLSMIPADSPFWTNVRDDAGDIRVVDDDSGTAFSSYTVLFGKISRVGMVIFDCSQWINYFENKTLRIYAGNPDALMPEATDVLGRNSVFSPAGSPLMWILNPSPLPDAASAVELSGSGANVISSGAYLMEGGPFGYNWLFMEDAIATTANMPTWVRGDMLTIRAWIIPAVASSYGAIAAFGDPSTGKRRAIYQSNNGLMFNANGPHLNANGSMSEEIAARSWTMVTAEMNLSDPDMYSRLAVQSSVVTNNGLSGAVHNFINRQLVIAGNESGGDTLPVSVAMIAIYPRKFTSTEVYTYYRNESSPTGIWTPGDWVREEDCDPFVIKPHGRQGIGVAQPQSGVDFPIVLPSEDVRYLFADFNISFDQPSDYFEVPAYKPPFRIKWLSGFGCLPAGFEIPTWNPKSSSWSSVCTEEASSISGSSVSHFECLPIPKNDYDIIIVDADDRIVFNSTDPDVECTFRDWTHRLRLISWQHPTNQTVTAVIHTAWGPNDFPMPRNYPVYFFPVAAVLDERAVFRLPKRVRSLTVVLDNMRKTGVKFVAGYNMLLQAGATTEKDGGRVSTRVSFNATPGAGIGVFPDCVPTTLQITSINGVEATQNGDFFISATGCYWVRQPTRVVSSDPLVSMPQIQLIPGSIPTANLPADNAGTTKDTLGWPVNDDPRYAHIQIGNDCPPCCDCPDYVAVADYMNEVRDEYQKLGKQFEGIRDLYQDNRERWLQAADCLLQKPLRIKLLAQICPFIDVSIQLCNQSGKCLTDVQLSVTLSTSPDGGVGKEVPGFTFITGARNNPGRVSPATDRYQMGGSWPTFTAFFDSVQPEASVNARFRLTFGDCEAYAVTGTLTATVKGDPLMTLGDNSQVATATDTQTLNCPAEDNSINYLACACDK